MSETDHDMMRVMRAQEELKESIKTITKTTKNKTNDRSNGENKQKQTGDIRKVGKVITNNANRISGEITSLKRERRTGSNSENRNSEENDEEGFSGTLLKDNTSSSRCGGKRNSKTFLQKLK